MWLDRFITALRTRKAGSADNGLRWETIQRLAVQGKAAVVPTLITALTDPIAEIRQAAALGLAEAKDRRGLAPLVKMLVHELDARVREDAASALATFDHKTWAPLLAKSLDDPNFNVRQTAAWAIRTIGWEHVSDKTRSRVAVERSDWALAAQFGAAALDDLKNALINGTSIARREAAEALGKIGDEKALAVLVAVLKDPKTDEKSREIAAWAVRHFSWPWLTDADAALAAIVAGDWSEVAGVGDAAVAALRMALKTGDTRTRMAATEALSEIGSPQAVEALIATLKEKPPDVTVRVLIARRLGPFGARGAVDVLLAGLNDDAWSVRHAAALSLHELGWSPMRDVDRALCAIAMHQLDEAVAVGRAAIAPLVDAVKLPAVSAEAAQALVQLGDEGRTALAVLSQNMQAAPAVREAASTALAEARDPRGVQPMVAMLNDPDIGVRFSAVWALERTGWEPTTAAEKAIVALAHDDWARVRQLGAAAIGSLLPFAECDDAPPEALDALTKIMEASASRLTIEQLKRLARLVDPSTTPSAGRSVSVAAAAGTVKLQRLVKSELNRRGFAR